MTKFLDLFGILYGCPAGNRHENCPVAEVDNYSFHDKIRWFEELSYMEKVRTQKHHMLCSSKRDNSKSPYKQSRSC